MKAFRHIFASKTLCARLIIVAYLCFDGSFSAQAQIGRGWFSTPAQQETQPAAQAPETLPGANLSPQNIHTQKNARRKKTKAIKFIAAEDTNVQINARILEKKIKNAYQKKDQKLHVSQQKFIDFLATGAIQVAPSSSVDTDQEKKDHSENSQINDVGSISNTSGPELNTIAKQYCGAIAQTANDARIAWQEKHIHELEEELNKRSEDLNARVDKFHALIAKHEDALQKADDNVVAIYAKMKPESAALQLAVMDEDAAAAILTKLNARGAGAILNEMPPDKAAHLTSIMSLRKNSEPERKKAS